MGEFYILKTNIKASFTIEHYSVDSGVAAQLRPFSAFAESKAHGSISQCGNGKSYFPT